MNYLFNQILYERIYFLLRILFINCSCPSELEFLHKSFELNELYTEIVSLKIKKLDLKVRENLLENFCSKYFAGVELLSYNLQTDFFRTIWNYILCFQEHEKLCQNMKFFSSLEKKDDEYVILYFNLDGFLPKVSTRVERLEKLFNLQFYRQELYILSKEIFEFEDKIKHQKSLLMNMK